MNIQYLVSVIIPAYNAAEYIEETLLSVLNQDYNNIEIIVVDDGSTDSTKDIVQKYSGRVKYYFKENGGQSSARNFGVEVSNGEIIAFIDADDTWHSSKISTQLNKMLKENLNWSFTDAYAINKGKLLYKFSDVRQTYSGDILNFLVQQNFIVNSSVLMFKFIFEEVGGFEINLPREDWDLWLRLAENYKADYTNIQLVNYRIHNQSSLRTTSIEKKLNSKIEIIARAEMYSQRLNKENIEIGRSNAYFEAAKMSLLNNNAKEARKYLRQALKCNLKIQFYAFYIFTFLNVSIIKKFVNIRIWLK